MGRYGLVIRFSDADMSYMIISDVEFCTSETLFVEFYISLEIVKQMLKAPYSHAATV